MLNKYNNERSADSHNDSEMDLKGGVFRDTSLIALFLGFLTAPRFSIVFIAYCLPALCLGWSIKKRDNDYLCSSQFDH